MILSEADRSQAPIFVTGLHRGGTTWVGRMLGCHRNVVYLHEPFSPDSLTGTPFGLRLTRWWIHIHPENEGPFLSPVGRMLSLDPSLAACLRQAVRSGDSRAVLREYRRQRGKGGSGARALVKDPIGFFSAEWLAHRFGARVVVVVRHPAAWVDSFLRTGWPQPRDGIRDQKSLCDHLLGPFTEILRAEESRLDGAEDRLARTCTTWNLFMHVLEGYRFRHPHWLFVRHEDLSADPLGQFPTLYRALGLDFSERCRDVVRANSLADDRRASYARESITRDSRRNMDRWRENLSAEAIGRIRERTGEYWPTYYPAEAWETLP